MNYKVFQNQKDLNTFLTNHIIELISNHKAKKFSMALSGGNTPKLYLSDLADNQYKVNWDKVFIFQIDERCVPPSHPESNYKMIKETFLDKVIIPPQNINRIKGENDPEEEVVNYRNVLKEFLVEKNNRFDIALLGMGVDGHTASIFPGQEFMKVYDRFTALTYFPATGQRRITVTKELINSSGEIIFVVTGKDKSEKVRQIFNDEKEAKALPAYQIKGNLLWLLDLEAASQL